MCENNSMELDEIQKEVETKESLNVGGESHLIKLPESRDLLENAVSENVSLKKNTSKSTGSITPERINKSTKMVKIQKKLKVMIPVGLFCIILGISTGILWPSLYKSILRKEIVLSPNSTSFTLWKETPIPMYLKIYLYNWTNHANTGEKPHFDQMGPYVFREVDYKVNQKWNENNDSISFQMKRLWYFESSMSSGSLSDSVTNLNPIAATIAYNVRFKTRAIKFFLDKALHKLETIVITKTVKEILFDGYDDILLKLVVDINMTRLPFEKFAWFYGRNGSETYDGTFNILTGLDNIYDIGVLKTWNYNNVSPYYSKSCGTLQGTIGDLWPPLLNNKTVSLFSPDVCTTLTLKAEGNSEWLGLKGTRFISDGDMFDNGTKVESKKCYCEGVDCQPSGTLNISLCKFGAPAFISLPHFYLADESYRQNISGMQPNKKDHEFFLVLQPDTGIPMQVRASMQINFLVQPDKDLSYFRDLPKMYVPMMWFSQQVNMTSDFGSQVKLLLVLPVLGNGILFSIAFVGIILIVISITIYVKQRLKNYENENLISKNVENEVIVNDG